MRRDSYSRCPRYLPSSRVYRRCAVTGRIIGCLVRGDESARVELINRYVLSMSLTWVMSGAYFRVWYGLLSDSEDTKVPPNKTRTGEPLPAAHIRNSHTVGKIFRETQAMIQPGSFLADKGIKSARFFRNGRFLYLDGGIMEFLLGCVPVCSEESPTFTKWLTQQESAAACGGQCGNCPGIEEDADHGLPLMRQVETSSLKAGSVRRCLL